MLVLLSILASVFYKRASLTLNHQTAPIFTPLWVLLGTIVAFPFYGELLLTGLEDLKQYVFILFLCILKGVFMWWGVLKNQNLIEKSLSASSFIFPLSLGLIAIFNSFLGEDLAVKEWIAVLGLCVIAFSFFMYGHMRELSFHGKGLFIKLVMLTIILAVIDQIILTHTNWFLLLILSNMTMLVTGLVASRCFNIWKAAFLNIGSVLAGGTFAVSEMLKFYLMVSILPMSVVLSAQASTIPIVLVLSALIWGERGWKEQALWGLLSMGFLLLLFL